MWMARSLSDSGYRADFSPCSIRSVDSFLDEHAPDGVIRPEGLLGDRLGQRLFGLGGYVGEVLRRSMGGTWEGDDADPEAEITVSLLLSDGGRVWPVQRVMKRAANGAEDGLAAYCATLGLDLDDERPPRRRLFGR